MGLFARRCMITGVSTGYAGSVAFVPVLHVDGEYRPTALPVWGTYDGYGSIGNVAPGPASERFCRAFADLLRSGVITIDWTRLLEKPLSPTTSEAVFKILERALVQAEGAITCAGRVLSFALLNGDVAEELLLELPTEVEPSVEPATLATLVCGAYEPALATFSDLHLQDADARAMFASTFAGFAALNQWLRRSGIQWCPPRETGQYNQTEAIGFLSAARERFSSEPLIPHGLQQYYDNDIQFEPDVP